MKVKIFHDCVPVPTQRATLQVHVYVHSNICARVCVSITGPCLSSLSDLRSRGLQRHGERMLVTVDQLGLLLSCPRLPSQATERCSSQHHGAAVTGMRGCSRTEWTCFMDVGMNSISKGHCIMHYCYYCCYSTCHYAMVPIRQSGSQSRHYSVA